MEKLFEIKEFGNFVYDKIFFESYYPILFTAKNENNDMFIGVCCLADGKKIKWLMTKTNANTVIDMLTNQITIRDSFIYSEFDKYSITLENNEYFVEKNCMQDWDNEKSIFLPTADQYIDAEEDEFADEIEYFSKLKIDNNNEYTYINVTFDEIKFDENCISSKQYKSIKFETSCTLKQIEAMNIYFNENVFIAA